MRDVSTAVANAIVNTLGVKYKTRFSAYKSRVFFETINTDNAPSFARPAGETGFPVPEAAGFNDTLGKVVTVAVNYDGNMVLMVHGKDPIEITDSGSPISMSVISRPGIWQDTVYFCVTDEYSGPQWKKLQFHPTTLEAGTAECVLFISEFSDITDEGAIYPISDDDEAVLLILDEGSVRPVFIDSEEESHHAPGRFINPTTVMTYEDDEFVFDLHYAGAVQVGNETFVYFSLRDGSVSVISFKSTSGLSLSWSDITTAIPEDLSEFKIGNVFSNPDGRIFICGKFQRREEFASGVPITMVPWSDDGRTFSMDRRIAVSVLAYRFLAVLSSTHIFFTESNRYYSETAPYQYIGTDANKTIVELLNVRGGPSKGWSASTKAGKEEYFLDPYVNTGSYATLEIGVQLEDSVEYIPYHEVVIAQLSQNIKDGQRSMDVNFIGDGAWHTSMMTHPFYIEFQGKQSIFDEIKELGTLYRTSTDTGETWTLGCDLWSDENMGGGESYEGGSHAADAEDTFWGPDLKDVCAEYPEFGSDFNYTIRIFGWSRPGLPDTNPNTADPTDTEADNDDFVAILEVMNADGSTYEVEATVGNLSSAYANPPQTYFDDGVRVGSYPVEYSITNPGEGLKIKRMGVVVKASSDGPTVFYLERIEMPAIPCVYKSTNEINFGISVPGEEGSGAGDSTILATWRHVDTITVQVDTDNATDGNKTDGSYTLDPLYAYAAIIYGDVEFKRDGVDYIQDGHYVASIEDDDPNYAPPSWERSYPPGTPKAQNSCVEITAGENPEQGSGARDWEDNVPPGYPFSSDHQYLFHIDNSEHYEDSQIKAEYIPYFFGGDDVASAAVFLSGSGVISDIVRGEFKIFIFESPIQFGSFYGQGGYVLADHFHFESVAGSGFQFPISPHSYGEELAAFGDSVEHDSSEGNLAAFGETFFALRAEERPHSIKVKASLEFWRNGTDGSAGNLYINLPGGDDGGVDTTGTVSGVGTFSLELEHIWTRATGGSPEQIVCTMGAELFGGYSWDWSMKYTVEINILPPDNPQVPLPPGFSVQIPTGETDNPIAADSFMDQTTEYTKLVNRRKGVPQIMLSTRPYKAFNFETLGRFSVHGPWSYAGLVGLAKDNLNFTFGYIRPGYMGIGVRRDGVVRTINEVENSDIEEGKLYDIRFWHRDGLFGIEAKRAQDTWPQRESQYTYEWEEGDNEISVDDEIFHVGIFSFINPPKFRTVGFRSSQTAIGVMEPDLNPDTGLSDFLNEFPSDGSIDIDGKIYLYFSKVSMFNEATPAMGPYQLRNLGNWQPPYNRDRSGDYTYVGGFAVEFLQFRWWEGDEHAEDYQGAVISSSAGYNWINTETQWKSWIRTGGEVVLLRNRARHYSDEGENYYADATEKMWVTNGLTEVRPAYPGDSEHVHRPGAFAYIDNDDQVMVHGFAASSGYHDNSIRSLLDKFCRLAGTAASFPGDTTPSDATLDEDEELEL